MTPEQARAARAFLNLDMKTVCSQAPVGKRTLAEFERGSRDIADTTRARLKFFYNSQGIEFKSSYDGSDVVILNHNIYDGRVRPKMEYEDRLGISKMATEIEKLHNAILKCLESINFSRDIANLALTSAGINQKQLAAELQCSPAFISAILLQKKILSVDMAKKIESKCSSSGFAEAVLFEKCAKKRLLDMQRLVDEIVHGIDHIRKTNAIGH